MSNKAFKNFKEALKYREAKQALILSLIGMVGCFIVPHVIMVEKYKTFVSFMFAILAFVEGDQYFKVVTILNMQDEEENGGKK